MFYRSISEPGSQIAMILDRVRTASFASAIERIVRPGDVVIDAGAGSGILSLVAARAGARIVYAIERSALAALVRRHADENGFGHVVKAVQADITQLRPELMPEPASVVVSETLGHFAPAENLHTIFSVMRPFTTRDAVMIPSAYRLSFALAAPRFYQREAIDLEDVCGFRLASLVADSRRQISYRRLTEAEYRSDEVFGDPISVVGLLRPIYEAHIPITADCEITAGVVRFEAHLAPGVTLRSSDCSSWFPVVCPLPAPLMCSQGEVVRFQLRAPDTARPQTWRWAITREPPLVRTVPLLRDDKSGPRVTRPLSCDSRAPR